MAAGQIQIAIKDGSNTSRNLNQWSSDGTTAGNFSQVVHIIDGENETVGAKADAAYTGSGATTLIAATKGVYAVANVVSVAAGAPADAAYAGSGSASLVATTKGIYAAANTVTVAAGAPADAAYAGSGSASLVALGKGLYTAMIAATPAGNNVIGNVGGKTTQVTVTPTVTIANNYGTNFCVGGLINLTGALTSTGTGMLQGITVTSKTTQTMGWTAFIFNANTTSTTWTDATVSAINSADINKARGPFVPPVSTQLGTGSVATLSGIGLPIAPGTTNVYAVVLSNGSLTNQFGTTSDVTYTFHFLPDA